MNGSFRTILTNEKVKMKGTKISYLDLKHLQRWVKRDCPTHFVRMTAEVLTDYEPDDEVTIKFFRESLIRGDIHPFFWRECLKICNLMSGGSEFNLGETYEEEWIETGKEINQNDSDILKMR